jgi:hypothetical protein
MDEARANALIDQVSAGIRDSLKTTFSYNPTYKMLVSLEMCNRSLVAKKKIMSPDVSLEEKVKYQIEYDILMLAFVGMNIVKADIDEVDT